MLNHEYICLLSRIIFGITFTAKIFSLPLLEKNEFLIEKEIKIAVSAKTSQSELSGCVGSPVDDKENALLK